MTYGAPPVLRPLQVEAIEGLRQAIGNGARRVLLVAPTGFGKTVVIVAIALRHLQAKPEHRVLVLVHRRELVRQMVDSLAAAGLTAVGVLQADTDPGDVTARIVVASVQTVAARNETPAATLVFWDEAHHCPALTFRAIASRYPSAIHLGATATPIRSDDAPLGENFDALVIGATVRQLTAQGLLVRSQLFAPPEPCAGLWQSPLSAYERHAPGTAAIVFASSVAHAQQESVAFNAAGHRAACIEGEMSARARDAALAQFAAGAIDVITNVFCLTEGWDAPRAETCIIARGCSNPGTWLQMVGRVLRNHPGKRVATVIDLRGSVHDVGLPEEDRKWSLAGTACVRTEPLAALSRCKECLAVFRPSSRCPRCGASPQVMQRLPRNLNRAEVLERVSDRTQAQRDAGYLLSLQRVALRRMRMPEWRAKEWAAVQFEKRFGRKAAA